MTTSNVTIYELSRNQFIEAAMRKCGALARGQTPATEDYTNGQIALNALIAGLQGVGMPIWKRTDLAITLTGTATYTIGVGQTTNTAFPLLIQHAYLQHTTAGTKINIEQLDPTELASLNATTTGRVVNYVYTPKINQGTLQVWPIPDSDTQSNYQLHIIYQKPFDGFTTSTETADFPQEWQNPIIYGLAMSIAPEYGVPLEDRKMLAMEFKQYLDFALGVSDVGDSIRFQIANNWKV